MCPLTACLCVVSRVATAREMSSLTSALESSQTRSSVTVCGCSPVALSAPRDLTPGFQHGWCARRLQLLGKRAPQYRISQAPDSRVRHPCRSGDQRLSSRPTQAQQACCRTKPPCLATAPCHHALCGRKRRPLVPLLCAAPSLTLPTCDPGKSARHAALVHAEGHDSA